MTNTIKRLLSAAVLLPAMVLTVGLVAQPAHAAFDKTIDDGAGSAKGKNQSESLFGDGSGDGAFTTITNVMLFLIGAISVIMLIIGGIRYVVSGGDSTAVQNAKNTILYAIVGIVVALLAFAVVKFVTQSFSSGN